MNSDDILARAQEISESLQSKSQNLNEDTLPAFMADVQASLSEIFELAQREIDRGLAHLETARDHLEREKLSQDAAALQALCDSINLAQTQLNLGSQVAQQTENAEPLNVEPTPELLLTPALDAQLARLETSRQNL